MLSMSGITLLVYTLLTHIKEYMPAFGFNTAQEKLLNSSQARTVQETGLPSNG